MSKRDIHVTARPDGGWGVGREGGQRQSSLHDTRTRPRGELGSSVGAGPPPQLAVGASQQPSGW